MNKVKNRWLIALAGVSVHLSIGSAYAWSIYTKPINALTEWSATSISFAFSIAIFCLGTSAAFMGKFVEHYGPRKTGMVASIFFGAGIALTGLAIQVQSLPMLYISYGLIGGIGLGSGYVTPVSTMVRWFPDHRGLATGLAIMGFGFASLVTSPIAQFLMGKVGVSNTFYILGALYFSVMFIASRYLEKPPKGWTPQGMVQHQEENQAGQPIQAEGEGLTANEALRTSNFWMLWLTLFLNITCGLGIVSAASPMAQEMIGMSDQTAAAMVGVMGIFNGLGRLFWATLSDRFGRPKVFTMVFIVNAAALTTLYLSGAPILFVGLICLIMTCYGAGFSIIPAYIGDVFGTRELGAIHGYILTAWAAAGIVGPILLSTVHQMTNSYKPTLFIFIVLVCIALIISVIVGRKAVHKK
ncbi:OFA family MFS transporter [Enterococcus sp. BWB1-3]|uniref:L-lactate MFS transporter n=1 Tax=Enterococcus sp. BWB1-3 TaxID=2787713 RepID=UPI0019231973|nr:OFA family MFS transporter [Enterococcus sp. BWB1-3]